MLLPDVLAIDDLRGAYPIQLRFSILCYRLVNKKKIMFVIIYVTCFAA